MWYTQILHTLACCHLTLTSPIFTKGNSWLASDRGIKHLQHIPPLLPNPPVKNKCESCYHLCVDYWDLKQIQKVPCCLTRYKLFHISISLYWIWYGHMYYKVELCHSTVSNLLVTYSMSTFIVSQQTYDVSCFGAFTEKGVFCFLLIPVNLLLFSFDIVSDLSGSLCVFFFFFFNCSHHIISTSGTFHIMKVKFFSSCHRAVFFNGCSINTHKRTYTDSTDAVQQNW